MKDHKTPILFFNLAKIEKNMKAVKVLSKKAGFKILFPVKSFPHEKILKVASKHLDGFDVSNDNEFKKIQKLLSPKHQLWVSGPNPLTSPKLTRRADGISFQSFYGLENSAESLRDEQVVFRIDSSSLLKDPRQSRFGWSLSEFKSLHFSNQKKISFSIHHGMQDTSESDLVALFSAILNLCQEKNIICHRFNFGGGWRGFTHKDITRLFTRIKKIQNKYLYPVEFFFEPGRWWFEEHGRAQAQILDIRPFIHGWDISLNISSGCHLKWSRPEIELPRTWVKSRDKILRFWGPTCSEQDFIFETRGRIPDKNSVNSITIKNIAGYSAAWNHSFNGVAEAKIEFEN